MQFYSQFGFVEIIRILTKKRSFSYLHVTFKEIYWTCFSKGVFGQSIGLVLEHAPKEEQRITFKVGCLLPTSVALFVSRSVLCNIALVLLSDPCGW